MFANGRPTTYPSLAGLERSSHASLLHLGNVGHQLAPFLLRRHVPTRRANTLMLNSNRSFHRIRDKVGRQAHRHMPRVKPSVTPATDILVLVAETSGSRKAQVFRHPALTSDFHRLITVFVAGIVQRGAIVYFVYSGRIHQATYRESSGLPRTVANQVVAIVTYRPIERRSRILFGGTPERRHGVATRKRRIRRQNSRRERVEPETVFARQRILGFRPNVARL